MAILRTSICPVLWWECKLEQPLEDSLVILKNVKQKLSIRLINSTLRNVPKRNKNMCSHKDSYMNVHSNITQNSQMDAIQMSTN